LILTQLHRLWACLTPLTTKARVARLLTGLGRYAEAETLAMNAIAEGEKTLPPLHSGILATRRQLARIKL